MGFSCWDLLKFGLDSVRYKVLFQGLWRIRRVKVLIQAIKRVQKDRPQEQGKTTHKTKIPELGSEDQCEQATDAQPIFVD